MLTFKFYTPRKVSTTLLSSFLGFIKISSSLQIHTLIALIAFQLRKRISNFNLKRPKFDNGASVKWLSLYTFYVYLLVFGGKEVGRGDKNAILTYCWDSFKTDYVDLLLSLKR